MPKHFRSFADLGGPRRGRADTSLPEAALFAAFTSKDRGTRNYEAKAAAFAQPPSPPMCFQEWLHAFQAQDAPVHSWSPDVIMRPFRHFDQLPVYQRPWIDHKPHAIAVASKRHFLPMTTIIGCVIEVSSDETERVPAAKHLVAQGGGTLVL